MNYQHYHLIEMMNFSQPGNLKYVLINGLYYEVVPCRNGRMAYIPNVKHFEMPYLNVQYK